MPTARTLPHPLLLSPAATPAATVPARDRRSEAAWLTLGGSICRRARESGTERRAATKPADALADLSTAVDRAEGAR